MSDTKYYRIHNASNKNSWMVTEDQLHKLKGKHSHFISTSYYNEEQFKEFQKTKSVAGVTDTKTNQLWFDFDSHTDVTQSQRDSVELISRLEKAGFASENIESYYSGSKGFHVIVKLQNELNSTQVKKIVSKFKEGLTTLDLQIYDANRILRAPNTKHEKTDLYKIPLKYEELSTMNLEQIQETAKQPRILTSALPGVMPPNMLVESVKSEVKPSVIDEKDPLKIKEIDFYNKPFGFKDYKWALAQGRFEIGQRHISLITVAATCKALKYGEDMTRAICETADRLHCELTNDEPIDESKLEKEIIGSVFSSNWSGGQFSKDNNTFLSEYCSKYGFENTSDVDHAQVVQIHDIHESYKDFVVNIDKNTITTGIEELDKAMPITVGTHLGIVGSASSGKTLIALEILKHTSMKNVPTVIASLDMHRNRLYEKLLYKVSGDMNKGNPLTREELYKTFQTNNDEKLHSEVKRQYGNVYFYDRSSPSVKDIREFVLNVERTTGTKVKLLMIDYFERVGSEINDATASSLKVASEIQDLINDLNLAVITLVQPNKFALTGGPDNPILSYTAIKGSSFLYQSFRGIVSIWRPFFTPKTKHLDEFLEMAILKNDLGEQDMFKFNFNGRAGTITSMTDEDYMTYNQYLEEKKEISAKDQPEQPFRKPF